MHYQLRPSRVPRARTEGSSPFFVLLDRPRSGLLEHVCTFSASVCLCPCIFIGSRAVHGQHHVHFMHERITNIASLACHLVFVRFTGSCICASCNSRFEFRGRSSVRAGNRDRARSALRAFAVPASSVVEVSEAQTRPSLGSGEGFGRQ